MKTNFLPAIPSVLCIAISACQASAQPQHLTAPLAFEATGSPAFLCRGDGFQATLLPEALLLRAIVPAELARRQQELPERPDILVRFVGANASARGIASDPLPGRSNYLIGADPSHWRTNVPNYARVKFAAVYPGIDVTYYGAERRLEHDFIVSPGADARRIRLALSGAEPERISPEGDLLLNWQGREIRWPRPTVYQEINGVRREIRGNYVRRGLNQVGFSIGPYDHSQPLVIDPVLTLSFSTYFGGIGYDWGAVALGPDGSPYLAGGTGSSNFPVMNPEQATLKGVDNVFVAKFSTDGSKLIYSTFIGGSGTDYGWAVAVDATGAVYVTGQTTSLDFPKVNAFQTQFTATGQYTFVVKLDPAGSKLLYSSPFGGGGEVAWGIAVDSAGNAYVAGATTSSDFPIVGGLPYKFVPNFQHGFVSKLAPAGDHLVFSTFLGGSGNDLPKGLALDTSANVYIAGGTSSFDFPLKNPYQSTNHAQDPNAPQTAFITKLDPTGAQLVYSTFLGGSVTEIALGIAVDAAGSAYVTGSTASGDFPTMNAFQPFKSGNVIQTNPFVTKLDPTGSSLVYSTFLGSGEGDAIALDSSGSVCITGLGNVPPALSLPASQAGDPGGVYLTKLNPSGTGLVFSTQIGGPFMGAGTSVAVDSSGNTYLAGITGSPSFPVVGGAQKSVPGGDFDAFLAKFALTNGGASVPAITQISPAAGDIFTGVTLQVTGQNFTSGSVVQWNGVVKSTTFVSATVLTVLLTSADIVTPGASWVNVSTPGAGWSNYLPFTVNGNVVPVLADVSISQFTVGQQTLTIQVDGAGLASSSLVQWNGNNLPTSFVSSTQLTATIPPANVAAPGTASITIYTPPPGGGTSAAESVMILAPPMIGAGGIVNAASYTQPVAAGELVSLFGTNFVIGASLLLNGVAVPVLDGTLQQINFQVPWQLEGQSISLIVSANGVNSSPQTIALVPYAPAIFSLNQQGTGQGAILIADSGGSVAGTGPGIIGRAVQAGESVEIYMTGLGPVLNPPASGVLATNASTTTSNPTVTIGGVSATVSYSGLAPTFIGLYQVNAVVPSGITTGPATPVVVTIGGVKSNMVTIATE